VVLVPLTGRKNRVPNTDPTQVWNDFHPVVWIPRLRCVVHYL
jgi:hypothetical protein